MRLGILGSTRGTHLQTLIDAVAANTLNANIACVISNKADAYILQRARDHQLPAHYLDATHLARPDFDAQLSELLKHAHVDLIVLIGYMRILSAEFVAEWENKIINVHPSLLPAFGGLMDLNVHRAVLAAGVSETGCSVHFVTQEVDAGPVILQKKCPVFTHDTPELLKARVQSLESLALIEGINQFRKTF